MSRIRFAGNTPASIPTPPATKANLFYDDTDKSFKAKLDDGTIVVLGVTQEYIEDIVGNLFTDSATIGVTYDDSGNIVTLEILPNSIDSSLVSSISPVKIIDEQNGRYKDTILTNDNTPTVIYTQDCSVNGIWLVEVRVTGRRIGGLSGSAGDGCTFKRTFRVKSISSSVTIHDRQSDYTSKDQSVFNIQSIVSGTNIIIRVIGAIDNNITWTADVITNFNI